MNSSSSSARRRISGARQVEVAPVDHEVVEHGELGVEAVLLRARHPSRARISSRRPRGPCRGCAARRSVGFDTQPIMRIVDVLPAPFGPRNPNASPGSTWKSMPSTATKLPKRFADVGTLDEGLGARERHERRRYRFPGARHRGFPAAVRRLRPRQQQRAPATSRSSPRRRSRDHATIANCTSSGADWFERLQRPRRSRTDVGDRAPVGTLAQAHDLVDRAEVGARRRLDHVGGDAATRRLQRRRPRAGSRRRRARRHPWSPTTP